MNANEDGTRGDLDTVDEIAELVRRFYREVAQDDLLGPIFNDVAQVDWAAHLPKLTAFWSRALLGEPGYEGNPYRMHMLVHERSPFTAAHFERWLLLFDEALAGWEGVHVEQARAFANRVAHVHSRALLGTPAVAIAGSEPSGALVGEPASPPVSSPAATPVSAPVARPSSNHGVQEPNVADQPNDQPKDQPKVGVHFAVHVDRDTCIGSGQCVHWAPSVFGQDEEAKAVLVASTDGREDVILKALVSCPVEAIMLEVGDVTVRARDLANWMSGVAVDDPLVDLLGRLSDEHHELKAALADLGTVDDQDTWLAGVSSQVADHLEEEERAYAAMRALVDPGLVDALRDGHARIDANLADLRDSVDGEDHERAGSLVAAIEDQIHLEESVLFPVALASLVRHAEG